MNHISAPPVSLHQYRRFGEIGPVYQIVSYSRVDDAGEQWLDVLLVESGEEVEYKASRAAYDPFEA